MRTTLLAALGAALMVSGCSLTLDPESVEPPVPTTAAPALVLTPTSLTFTAIAGAALPAARTVSVGNSAGGSLAAPTVSIDASGSAWLDATVSGTGVPYTLTVRPKTTALAPGHHAATVTIASAGASNSPSTLDVTYTIAATPPPAMGGCVESGGHAICALAGSAGARAAVTSGPHAIRGGALSSGAAADVHTATHAIVQGVVTPGASKP